MTRHGKPRKQRNSKLSEHKRHRKTLSPPLLALGPTVDFDWRGRLPNMLWLGALLQEYPGDWRVADALEVLDTYIPDPSRTIDGRLTSFELVPPPSRSAARRALALHHPLALPDGLGHALALYDDCPGRWLYEDWAFNNDHDRNRGLAYVRRLIIDLADSRGEFAVHARMLSLGRYLAHGRIFFTEKVAESVEVLSRYPSGCNEEERQRARQVAKMTYDMVTQHADPEEEDRWGRSFWRQAARLVRSGNPAARGLG